MVALAMRDDPLHVYFAADPERRDRLLYAMYSMFSGYALRRGMLSTSAGAVAIWQPPQVVDGKIGVSQAEDDEPAAQGVRGNHRVEPRRRGTPVWSTIPTLVKAVRFVRTVGGRSLLRIIRYQLFAVNVHRRIVHGPHWYLMLLAVEPVQQGKGLASGLIRPVLARADRARYPCYLETQNPANLPLYRHFGFEIARALRVPGTSVGHWCMIRPPHTTLA